MKRLLVVYNSRSSRFSDVKASVLNRLTEFKGCLVGKYEIKPTDVDRNAATLAKLINDDDLIVSAGGDATGVIAVNAILKSGKNATLLALPYGNFNDLARTLGTKNLDDIHALKTAKNFYPLEIAINDIFFRYAACYATIGMTAEAVKLYNQPKMRKILKTTSGRHICSYTRLAGWYFKNRQKKSFLPQFELNKKLQPTKTSDYIAVNGRYVARIMKNPSTYGDSSHFYSTTARLTSILRLTGFMSKSIFAHIPSRKTHHDILTFQAPAVITIQTEGEHRTFSQVQKVEIKKSQQPLKVLCIQ